MSPFQEVAHTADWALHVWAPTREALFADAARGMYALSGVSTTRGHERRRVAVAAEDHESLLVAWLHELLYYTESEDLVFSEFTIEALSATGLRAEALGEKGKRPEKFIKAVTYHNLKIERTNLGYEVTIVFDV